MEGSVMHRRHLMEKVFGGGHLLNILISEDFQMS